MRSFSYRFPRFSVDLPVQLLGRKAEEFVRCTEISVEGMTLELTGELPAGTRGCLQVRYDEQNLDLPFETAYSQSNTCGVSFLFESSAQRNAVCHLIRSLLTPRPCTSLALRG